MLESNVLLLNQNFEPITLCSVKRAIIMVWLGKAEIIESAGDFVHTVSREFVIPSIIRLLDYVKIKQRCEIQLTRQNVIRRDHHRCQYCGRTDGPMTVDHVVPRSQGGRDTWHNLVSCCPSCNNRKRNRTPLQAGMDLISKPSKPNVMTFRFLHRGPVHKTWRSYLHTG